MFFKLKRNVFAEKVDWSKINLLFLMALHSNVHFVFYEDNQADENYQEWLGHQPKGMKKIIEKFFETSEEKFLLRRSQRFFCVSCIHDVDKVVLNQNISLAQALVEIKKPFKVYVENSINDRAFLRAFLNQSKAQQMDCYERNFIVEFANSGGNGNLKKILDEFIDDSNKHYMYFITDSDKKPHDSDLTGTALAIRDLANSKGIEGKFLNRRAIENYVPKEMVASENGHDYANIIWGCHSPILNHFFNFKRGVVDRENNFVPEEICCLTEDQKEILSRGANIAKYFHPHEWAKTHFSKKNFSRDTAAVREINEIFSKIEGML